MRLTYPVLYRSADQLASILQAAGISEGHKHADIARKELQQLKDSIFGLTIEDTDDESSNEDEEALGLAPGQHTASQALPTCGRCGVWLKSLLFMVMADVSRLLVLCHVLASTANSFFGHMLGSHCTRWG